MGGTNDHWHPFVLPTASRLGDSCKQPAGLPRAWRRQTETTSKDSGIDARVWKENPALVEQAQERWAGREDACSTVAHASSPAGLAGDGVSTVQHASVLSDGRGRNPCENPAHPTETRARQRVIYACDVLYPSSNPRHSSSPESRNYGCRPFGRTRNPDQFDAETAGFKTYLDRDDIARIWKLKLEKLEKLGGGSQDKDETVNLQVRSLPRHPDANQGAHQGHRDAIRRGKTESYAVCVS